ncbi:MarR family winged helix-turn-helix transcriptional regulator [Chryseobacterium fluminis]|uniref:MarR family winged helix-turn-helix transcriptional regulator n=1 Tax=Chryseobacterium fluminis TaxID=2983606 RepID=UPI0022576C23|nr:MarR family winged helix-turn-helix transcriptional regulator [Chryseobacterium sp. MMS21-Ot14]UZT99216.1 MarR family winged helix-turn-helix transcriptional regulator [Chryseobacterium sp. MMS21-Ot14]
MNTDFFIDLLQQVKKFENSGSCKPHSTVEDFRIWMNDAKYREESPTKLFKSEQHQVSFTENEICKQVLLLGRYSRQLIRKGLSEFPELANEEFTYLYRLKDEPNLTKIQLIERNGHEKQTGTQIIRRLLEYGLIEEKNDIEDKRSKRLNITDKGKDYFHRSVEKVNITSRILAGKLENKEKAELFELLRKLNDFHSHIYCEYRNSGLHEIVQLIE